jgi:hypothetical protein
MRSFKRNIYRSSVGDSCEILSGTAVEQSTASPTVNYLITECGTGDQWNAQKTKTYQVGDVVQFLVKINEETIRCGTITSDNYTAISDIRLYGVGENTYDCLDTNHCNIPNPSFGLT